MTTAIEIGWVDIALLAFLVLSVLIGLARGVVFELLSLAGWFIGYFVALWGAPLALPYIHTTSSGSALNYAIAFACVFLLTVVLWSVAARLVRALIRATPLSPFDRLLGAGFGFVRGLVILLVMALVVGVSPWSGAPQWRQSRCAAWLEARLHDLRPFFFNHDSSYPSA